jgi:hypothetical protein
MAGGALDQIVAKVEAYIGEFLGTRAQLLDAKGKIDSALTQAQSSGSARIGTKTYTFGELQTLSAENTALLNRNAELQTKISDFKDQVASVQSGATNIMDTLVANPDAEYPWYDTPGIMGNGGMGALPAVAIPAAYLVAAGALLATTIYVFIGNVRSHLGSVAGEVGSNLILYGGIALAAFWYAKKQRWI